MSKIDYKFISHAYNEALKSIMLYRHGCIIRKGKKIIAKGYNTPYISSINCKDETCSLHAELSAIKDMIHKSVTNKNVVLYVVRIDKQYCLAESKPCTSCCEIIISHGINKIVYSVSGGNIIKQSIGDIVSSTRESRATRYFL